MTETDDGGVQWEWGVRRGKRDAGDADTGALESAREDGALQVHAADVRNDEASTIAQTSFLAELAKQHDDATDRLSSAGSAVAPRRTTEN